MGPKHTRRLTSRARYAFICVVLIQEVDSLRRQLRREGAEWARSSNPGGRSDERGRRIGPLVSGASQVSDVALKKA